MRTIPLTKLPLVSEGDDLGELILESTEKQGVKLENGDVLVVAQSVVSKAEGGVVDLEEIRPCERAVEIGERTGEDPRKAEVILNETEEVVRLEHVIVSRTEHGFVCADAGVDSSNVEPGEVTVLPEEPDEAAEEIREKIMRETGEEVAVVISDSWGRPFRLGSVGFAVGVAGMEPLVSLKGKEDSYGNSLETTELAPPDSLAATAALEMGEAGEGTPAVIVRGYSYEPGEGSASDLVRPEGEDLFR